MIRYISYFNHDLILTKVEITSITEFDFKEVLISFYIYGKVMVTHMEFLAAFK